MKLRCFVKQFVDMYYNIKASLTYLSISVRFFIISCKRDNEVYEGSKMRKIVIFVSTYFQRTIEIDRDSNAIVVC